MKTKKVDNLIQQLVIRMAEIDGNITSSQYNMARVYAASPNDIQDRTPDGDDYNLLWDAVLDECNALRPGVLDRMMAEYRKPV